MLLGHDQPWREWRKAMGGERMHHAWLLAGRRGVGKGSFALAVARELIGAAPGEVGSHPDIITLTYGLGVGLAAFAGVLAAPIYSVNPIMGSNIIIVVFAIVVIGGLGSIGGANISGFMLGVIAGIHPAGSILPAATLASGAHVGAAAAAPVPLRLQPARGASYHVAPPHSTAATAVARPTGSLASLWVVVAKLCEILFGW